MVGEDFVIGLEYILKVRLLDYKHICEELSISSQTLNDWIRGRRTIPSKRLSSLSKFLNIDEELIAKDIDNNDKKVILKMEINRLSEFLRS